MKRFFIILIIIGTALSSSNNKYLGNCLLIPRHEKVPLYNSSNQLEISDYIINDTLKDDYPLITIDFIKDSLALVHVQYPMRSRKECKGWIQMKYLGTYINQADGILKIYRMPSDDSEVSFEIMNASWGIYYPVIDAHEGWLKVVIPDDSGRIGWLHPDDQSQNPYTPSC